MDIRWIRNEKGMTLRRNGDVIWLSWPEFDKYPWLKNAFSTRFGGVSTGDLAAMNLGFGRGDDPENVLTNFRKMAKAAGFSAESIVCTQQTHTTNVRRVGRSDRGRGILRDREWKDVDGLITDEPDVALTIFCADCVPLYFVDPVHRAIGLSHSGWRGTADGMARVTIEMMEKEFGSDPKKMKAAIGPSVCQDCYEVSADVAMQFPNCYLKPHGKDKFLLDLQGANRGLMVEAGIPAESVYMPNLCTACNPDFLFSHRASGGRRGSLAAFLCVTEAAPDRLVADSLIEAALEIQGSRR